MLKLIAALIFAFFFAFIIMLIGAWGLSLAVPALLADPANIWAWVLGLFSIVLVFRTTLSLKK